MRSKQTYLKRGLTVVAAAAIAVVFAVNIGTKHDKTVITAKRTNSCTAAVLDETRLEENELSAIAVRESPMPPESDDTQNVSEPAKEAPDSTGLVNINTADLEELKTLNGIGDVKAQAVIDYRNAHGPFTSAEQITDVKGIGEKTLEKIRAYITV